MIEWRPELMAKASTFVPEHLRGGLCRYVEQGIEPGNGLRMILENRPLGTVVAAVDRDVEPHLGSIFRFLYNAVGAPAWGDEERVAAWLAQKGMQGQ